MTVEAIVEIPKGDNRRRHLNYERTGFIDLGPISDKIPVNDGVLLADYGLIANTRNTADDDELDILIIGSKNHSVGERVAITPIATLIRGDGDNKVIATEDDQTWEELPDSLKQWLNDFCGYHSPIIKVLNQEDTEKLIASCQYNQTYPLIK